MGSLGAVSAKLGDDKSRTHAAQRAFKDREAQLLSTMDTFRAGYQVLTIDEQPDS